MSRSRLKSIPRQGTRVSTSSPRISLSNLRSAVSAAAYRKESYIDGPVLVLPAHAATNIVEAHPRGYHNGVWHLATEYEAFCAQALLTNSNPLAPGHEQPKSFSAWPRRHDVNIYRRASIFRANLSKDVSQTSPADRATYLDLVSQWHHSVSYISHISGASRLDQNQMEQLCVAIALDR